MSALQELDYRILYAKTQASVRFRPHPAWRAPMKYGIMLSNDGLVGP